MAEFGPTDDFAKAVDRAAGAATGLGWCVICGRAIVGARTIAHRITPDRDLGCGACSSIDDENRILSRS